MSSNGDSNIEDPLSFFYMADEIFPSDAITPDDVVPSFSLAADVRLESIAKEINKLDLKEEDIEQAIKNIKSINEQAKVDLIKEIEAYEKEQAKLLQEIKEAEAAVNLKKKELAKTEASLVKGGGGAGGTIADAASAATYFLGPLGALGVGRSFLQQREKRQEELRVAQENLRSKQEQVKLLNSQGNLVSKNRAVLVGGSVDVALVVALFMCVW